MVSTYTVNYSNNTPKTDGHRNAYESHANRKKANMESK